MNSTVAMAFCVCAHSLFYVNNHKIHGKYEMKAPNSDELKEPETKTNTREKKKWNREN